MNSNKLCRNFREKKINFKLSKLKINSVFIKSLISNNRIKGSDGHNELAKFVDLLSPINPQESV